MEKELQAVLSQIKDSLKSKSKVITLLAVAYLAWRWLFTEETQSEITEEKE